MRPLLGRRASRGILRRHVSPAPGALPKLLTAQEAAAVLGVPPSWLLAQARADRVPHQRLGKYVRFDPAALTAWLAATRRGGQG